MTCPSTSFFFNSSEVLLINPLFIESLIESVFLKTKTSLETKKIPVHEIFYYNFSLVEYISKSPNQTDGTLNLKTYKGVGRISRATGDAAETQG